jgi:hypothetical protein
MFVFRQMSCRKRFETLRWNKWFTAPFGKKKKQILNAQLI